jgi:hypothetical protein
MSRFAQGVAVAVILSVPLVARGHGLSSLRTRTAVAYYYPVTVQYVPVVAYNTYPICVTPPLPVTGAQRAAPGRPYAPPTAAPPSAGPSTPEPPLAAPPGPAKPSPAPPDRALGFGESISFYDSYSLASQNVAKPVGERCTADFWNLTDRDLVLRIDGGAPQVLPRGKRLPAAVGRQFTWHVEGREVQAKRVDDGETALQTVIRR